MKCKIIGQSLRVFSKGIRLFSKLSNEVLISVDHNEMKLQAINDNKTAFIELLFDKTFFACFECTQQTKCKLFMKSLILVFRVLNIDKIVETCTLIMDESMPRVVFEMKCLNGVSREYFVPYMESTNLNYNSSLNSNNPTFKVQSKLLSECLHNFSNETKDISIWLTSQQILFKSYFDDIEEQSIMTSFAYNSREFQNYCFTNEISVTFDVKDLKTFLEFTSFHDQTIECYFVSSGKPIEFKMNNSNDNYCAKLILATHDFPEDHCPVPPSQALHNQSLQQNISLFESGDLSVENPNPINSNVVNSIHAIESLANPDSIPNTIVNTVNNNNTGNEMVANNGNELDVFGDEDDDEFEQLISQLPEFSSEELTHSNISFSLTGRALQEYHRSVLFGNEEGDDPDLIASQDIMVPESDDEQ